MLLLPDELLLHVLTQLSAWQAGASGRVCRAWRECCEYARRHGLFRRVYAVTSAGSNEVVFLSSDGCVVSRIKARPPSLAGERARAPNMYPWPTCLAFGPRGELFVSQYRVRGLLEFAATGARAVYIYRRKLACSPALAAPEGVVVRRAGYEEEERGLGHAGSRGRLYVVSVEHATISRVDESSGRVVEQLQICPGGHSFADDGPTGPFLVLWGMAEGPREKLVEDHDGEPRPLQGRSSSSLFVASHEVSEEEQWVDYTVPTARDSGCVLRVPLNADGSFLRAGGGPDGSWPYEYLLRGLLNRPSNVAFCAHGHMLVTSFRCREWRQGAAPSAQCDRVVYKFRYGHGECIDVGQSGALQPHRGPTRGFMGMLAADVSLRGAWSVACSRNHWRCACGLSADVKHEANPGCTRQAELLVTCHETASAPAGIARLGGCGCQPRVRPPSGPEHAFGPLPEVEQHSLARLQWSASGQGGGTAPPTWEGRLSEDATWPEVLAAAPSIQVQGELLGTNVGLDQPNFIAVMPSSSHGATIIGDLDQRDLEFHAQVEADGGEPMYGAPQRSLASGRRSWGNELWEATFAAQKAFPRLHRTGRPQ